MNRRTGVDSAHAGIDRQHARDGSGATPPTSTMPEFDFRFQSLSDFVTAHRDEIA